MRGHITESFWRKDDPPAIPPVPVAPNDMRAREVDRAKVKQARKAARKNRRRR